MSKIETAFVSAPTLGLRSKEMKFAEAKEFAEKHGFGVYNRWHDKVEPVDDYLKPVRRPVMEYGFFTGRTYDDSPSIDLVPFGTIVEYGMYVYPENK